MPKGAVLHAHLNAMLPYDTVFQTMMNTPGMVMSAKTNLATEENRNMTAIKFGHSNTTIPAGPSIWTAKYVPGTLVNMTTAANSFPGGKAAFLAFLKGKVTLTAEDYHEAELGIDAIWRKFQGIFNTVRTTWAYEPLIRQFLQNLFKSLAADNIRWLEVRTGAALGVVKDGESSCNRGVLSNALVIVEGCKMLTSDRRQFFYRGYRCLVQPLPGGAQKVPSYARGQKLLGRPDHLDRSSCLCSRKDHQRHAERPCSQRKVPKSDRGV